METTASPTVVEPKENTELDTNDTKEIGTSPSIVQVSKNETSKTTNRRRKKQVGFQSVEIREYDMIPGDSKLLC